jgi:uncharacterized membrane protein (UPF0127 family)
MRRTLILLAAALVAIAVACSDGDDAAPPATSTAAGSATASATATSTAPAEPTASTGAIPAEQLPVIEFLRDGVLLASLPVEVPPSSDYSVGLSGRHELGERGMLFHYDPPGNTGFWMLNTHVDLSIAFVGADSRIDEIHEMRAESQDIIRPVEVYSLAIEAPAGWYAANGVEPGDEARLAFDLADFPE